MKPIRVAVDFDGTLAATHNLVCELINFRRGTNVQPADVTSWDWWKDHGYDKDFWSAYDLMDRTHLRRAIRPTSPLACASIKYLQQQGYYEFDVLTMNHEKAAKDMVAWLFGHGLDLPVKAVGRIGVEQKAAMDYGIFIDDAPHLAEAISKLPDKRMILIDQPWNQEVPCEAWADDGGVTRYITPDGAYTNVFRLNDWAGVLALFEYPWFRKAEVTV